jgi:catechol 2,3-dioxygenase-like lactoylglutathione lyase family enzyme
MKMNTSAPVDRLKQRRGNRIAEREPGRDGLAKRSVAVGQTTKAKLETETPQVIGVGHVALSARDPVALAEFYRDVLSLQVVPTETSDLGESAFLSSHPVDASVDLVLFANPAFQHTAFEAGSLADLRVFHQRILDRGVPVKMALNHGVTFSFYFEDPERALDRNLLVHRGSPVSRAMGIQST